MKKKICIEEKWQTHICKHPAALNRYGNDYQEILNKNYWLPWETLYYSDAFFHRKKGIANNENHHLHNNNNNETRRRRNNLLSASISSARASWWGIIKRCSVRSRMMWLRKNSEAAPSKANCIRNVSIIVDGCTRRWIDFYHRRA